MAKDKPGREANRAFEVDSGIGGLRKIGEQVGDLVAKLLDNPLNRDPHINAREELDKIFEPYIAAGIEFDNPGRMNAAIASRPRKDGNVGARFNMHFDEDTPGANNADKIKEQIMRSLIEKLRAENVQNIDELEHGDELRGDSPTLTSTSDVPTSGTDHRILDAARRVADAVKALVASATNAERSFGQELGDLAAKVKAGDPNAFGAGSLEDHVNAIFNKAPDRYNTERVVAVAKIRANGALDDMDANPEDLKTAYLEHVRKLAQEAGLDPDNPSGQQGDLSPEASSFASELGELAKKIATADPSILESGMSISALVGDAFKKAPSTYDVAGVVKNAKADADGHLDPMADVPNDLRQAYEDQLKKLAREAGLNPDDLGRLDPKDQKRANSFAHELNRFLHEFEDGDFAGRPEFDRLAHVVTGWVGDDPARMRALQAKLTPAAKQAHLVTKPAMLHEALRIDADSLMPAATAVASGGHLGRDTSDYEGWKVFSPHQPKSYEVGSDGKAKFKDGAENRTEKFFANDMKDSVKMSEQILDEPAKAEFIKHPGLSQTSSSGHEFRVSKVEGVPRAHFSKNDAVKFDGENEDQHLKRVMTTMVEMASFVLAHDTELHLSCQGLRDDKPSPFKYQVVAAYLYAQELRDSHGLDIKELDIRDENGQTISINDIKPPEILQTAKAYVDDLKQSKFMEKIADEPFFKEAQTYRQHLDHSAGISRGR